MKIQLITSLAVLCIAFTLTTGCGEKTQTPEQMKIAAKQEVKQKTDSVANALSERIKAGNKRAEEARKTGGGVLEQFAAQRGISVDSLKKEIAAQAAKSAK